MRPQFVNEQIYHVYNRGVDKREVFLNDEDRFRFIHDLYEFNDEAPALNIYYKLPQGQSYEVQLRKILEERKKRTPRKLLVEILSFCLMNNHFHLLLCQKKDNGITKFMQKLGTGYTNYFNKTYERSGALFQGRYKAILIGEEAHLLHLPYYIHANPIDIINPNWKEEGVDAENAVRYLESYRWSSYLDYIGKKNFSSLTSRDFLNDYYKNNFRGEMINWLKQIQTEWKNIKRVTLE